MTKKEKLLEGIKKMSDRDFWYWIGDILGRDLVTNVAIDSINYADIGWVAKKYDFLTCIGILGDGDDFSCKNNNSMVSKCLSLLREMKDTIQREANNER